MSFNPLAVPNVALILALELLEQDLTPLPPAAAAPGVGVYAIYYTGDFEPYAPIVGRGEGVRENRAIYGEVESSRGVGHKRPIYVGKAVRSGARKGINFEIETQARLMGRLRNHARSIEHAENLTLDEFHCRFLVVEDAFVGLAESVLIGVFRPLWNQVIDGFGNNPTGGPRSAQARSDWDVLHPGRVRGLGKAKRSREELLQRIEAHHAATTAESADEDLRRISERVRKYTGEG